MEKLSADVEALCRDRIYHYFRRLSDIPRRSFHEKAVSDYIYNWALEHGWNAERDAVYNVFIHKAASPGCENAPTVMLQAHLDMVCEKRADSQ